MARMGDRLARESEFELTERQVGIYGIESVILQGIRLDFFGKTDYAPLLWKIN